ncbi:MAG: ferredoxin reductase family protein [Acetobacteraceae bacterium]|nr:ferredoxin reductase family protein [Acetobacteraceae bacterium]
MPAAGPALLAAAYATVALAPALLLPDGRGLWDHAVSGLTRVAFALFFIEFVLSGRFRPISDPIGMDTTMRLHQGVARPMAVLLLLHPFLYAAVPAPAGLAAATGLAAWPLLALLVVTAIGRDSLPWTYEAWRLTHGLGALVLAGVATLHAVLAPAGAHPALAWLWLVLFGLAAASLVSVYLIRPITRARRPWRVVSVTPAADRTWVVTIAAEGHAGLRFKAGQFVWLVLDRGPASLREHPFSIASPPSDPARLSFVIAAAGDFTNGIGALRVGAPAYVDGPHGALTPLARPAAGFVFIAGGTGIAPVLSVLREAAALGDRRPMRLVVGAWRAERLVARAEIATLAERLDLSVVEVLSDPPPGWQGEAGVLDAAVLARHCGRDRAGHLHVLCGPPAMLTAATAALRRLGVRRGDIMAESFRYG